MRVFVVVAEAGTLSGAARQLSLTPSAVSKGLGRLEHRLGVRLVDRSSRGSRLTEEGLVFFERCKAILHAIEEAEREVSQRRRTARGTLRINASVPVAHYCLAPLMADFLAAHPDLEIDMNVSDSVVDLFEERADVAIRVGPLADSSLRARKIGDIRRVVVASPAYIERRGAPTCPAQLADHNCLNFNFGDRLNTWRFGELGEFRTVGRVRVNCGDTLRHLALAGAGIARLGTFLVAGDLREGRLQALLSGELDEPLEPVHAVYRGGKQLSARVRVFVDYLVEHVRF